MFMDHFFALTERRRGDRSRVNRRNAPILRFPRAWINEPTSNTGWKYLSIVICHSMSRLSRYQEREGGSIRLLINQDNLEVSLVGIREKKKRKEENRKKIKSIASALTRQRLFKRFRFRVALGLEIPPFWPHFDGQRAGEIYLR